MELTGELADGWIGTSFVPEHADVFMAPLQRGLEKSGRSLSDLIFKWVAALNQRGCRALNRS